jgi:hypothetical protein
MARHGCHQAMRIALALFIGLMAGAASAQGARTVQDCTRLVDPVEVRNCIRALGGAAALPTPRGERRAAPRRRAEAGRAAGRADRTERPQRGAPKAEPPPVNEPFGRIP